MRHLTYLGLLAACLLGTLPLELVLGVRVYARWRRLVAALVPGLAFGLAWDYYAVGAGHWHFDRRYLVGLDLAGLPLEEVLFFVVIPICAVLTLEAVGRRRPGWLIGDEPPEPPESRPAMPEPAEPAESCSAVPDSAEADEGRPVGATDPDRPAR